MNTLHWEGYIRFGIYAAKKIKFMMGKQASVDHCPRSLNGSDQNVGILHLHLFVQYSAFKARLGFSFAQLTLWCLLSS